MNTVCPDSVNGHGKLQRQLSEAGMSDGEVGDVVDPDVLFSEVDGVLDAVEKPAMHVYPLPAANSQPSRSTLSTSATKKQGPMLRLADLG
ncbi:hypothetical protein C5C24_07415 [Rathayibacter sp. AY2B3]|nr:hypothetical protein C5C24_07415 [Rathayibacter sp. AY2B3]PPI23884.1 hypothetical protein C5D44_12895 [Rathayibacter sp. AY1B5]